MLPKYIWYERIGDYYIPVLTLSSEEQRPIGKWGRMHRDYIKEHRPILFNDLILSGHLWVYLVDLNEQAQERLDTIMEQMKAADGVTEELKRTHQMEWVQRCNNIHNRAEEIILHEMIYCGRMIMTNRKLTRSFDSVKKIFLKIVIGVVLACILFVCFLYTNNEIGVTSSKLEADIRSSQKIKDDWTVDGSVSSTMAAYISYPQDLSDHSFSVYVNRPGLSFGYFFRGGGTLSGIQRGIVEFTVEGYNERAFISMNQQQVQQLEIDDGNTIQVVDIDRNKPFAIVLPINAGNITFYDVNRNTVEYWNNPL